MKINTHGVRAEGPWQVAIPVFSVCYVGFLFINQWAWNTLAAGVIGAPTLTIWQALAGQILLGIAVDAVHGRKESK